MPTYVPPVKTMPTKWHVIDANGKVLGRVATDAAKLLQGKHKAIYTPYLDTGDHVVIINVAKVKLTGRKDEQKVYQRHRYPAWRRRAKVVRREPERMRKNRAACSRSRKLVMRCTANEFLRGDQHLTSRIPTVSRSHNVASLNYATGGAGTTAPCFSGPVRSNKVMRASRESFSAGTLAL